MESVSNNVTKDLQKRASYTRSAWLARARKANIDISTVPSRAEIQAFLEESEPFVCYLSEHAFVPYNSIELDHKQPISRGGTFSLDNVGITTRYYNNIKGQMTESEFRSLLGVVLSWEDKGKALFKRLMSSNHIYRRFSKRKTK